MIEYNISPDVVLGDFDSTDESIINKFTTDVERIKLPIEKDDTDSAYAIKYAIDSGVNNIYLYGALGGSRFDHSIANMSMVAYCVRRGVNCHIIDEKCMITAVHNSSLKFEAKESGDISLFAFGGTARGVSIKGLKYELKDSSITCDFPIGVSNSFVGSEAEISVREGMLIVICGR